MEEHVKGIHKNAVRINLYGGRQFIASYIKYNGEKPDLIYKKKGHLRLR
jgi:hypothetical protein